MSASGGVTAPVNADVQRIPGRSGAGQARKLANIPYRKCLHEQARLRILNPGDRDWTSRHQSKNSAAKNSSRWSKSFLAKTPNCALNSNNSIVANIGKQRHSPRSVPKPTPNPQAAKPAKDRSPTASHQKQPPPKPSPPKPQSAVQTAVEAWSK